MARQIALTDLMWVRFLLSEPCPYSSTEERDRPKVKVGGSNPSRGANEEESS